MNSAADRRALPIYLLATLPYRYSLPTDPRRSKTLHEHGHPSYRSTSHQFGSAHAKGEPCPQHAAPRIGGPAASVAAYQNAGISFCLPPNPASWLCYVDLFGSPQGLCQPFNTHRCEHPARGLVQSIFSPPSRRSGFVLSRRCLAPRRWAKNALQWSEPITISSDVHGTSPGS